MYCDPEGMSAILTGGAIFGLIAAIIAAMAAVAVVAVEVQIHAISNALNALGNAIARVFGNITDFFASLNNARNVALPGLDYSGYINSGMFSGIVFSAEHTKNKRPSTKGKHQKGQARKQRDKRGGEKGDARRPVDRGNKRRKFKRFNLFSEV